MTDLAERLALAMKGPPEVKPSELAKACGIKQPSINDWLNGRTKKLEGANLLAAAECLGVLPWWLAAGKGPMRSPMSQQEIRDVIRILQGVSDETRHVLFTQIKAFEDQISEKVNEAAAENNGKIISRPSQGHERHQSAQEQGVEAPGSEPFGDGKTSLEEAAGNAQRRLKDAAATTKGKKTGQGR